MSKVSMKGVVIGGVTDIVSSSILGIPLVVYVMSSLDLKRLPKDQVQPALVAAIHSNASFHAVHLLVGLVCSALGGYVAAWLAKHDEILNGALSSFLCIAIGIYSISAAVQHGQLWEQLLVLAASPVFALFGGYLRFAQVLHRALRA